MCVHVCVGNNHIVFRDGLVMLAGSDEVRRLLDQHHIIRFSCSDLFTTDG